MAKATAAARDGLGERTTGVGRADSVVRFGDGEKCLLCALAQKYAAYLARCAYFARHDSDFSAISVQSKLILPIQRVGARKVANYCQKEASFLRKRTKEQYLAILVMGSAWGGVDPGLCRGLFASGVAPGVDTSGCRLCLY